MRYILFNKNADGWYTGVKREGRTWTQDFDKIKVFKKRHHAASAASLLYSLCEQVRGFDLRHKITDKCFLIQEVSIDHTGAQWEK